MDRIELQKIETGPCIRCGLDEPGLPKCQCCGTLTELPPKVNYFEALGLAPRFGYEPQRLQEAFHKANKVFHPDRYSDRSEEEKNCSLAWSSLANTAYRTLREPRSRAEYLLKLLGVTLPETEMKKVPVAIAEEYFEVQEALMEGDPAGIQKMDKTLEDLRRFNDQHLQSLFQKGDEGLAEGRIDRKILESIAGKLNERNYLETMCADLKERSARLHKS